MMRRLAFALTCLAALGPAAAERAATFAESFADAAPMFGHWRIWLDVEDMIPGTDCDIELLPTHANEQFGLVLGPECAARYPALKSVTGWQALYQAIDFVDSVGQVRIGFVGRGPDWMVGGEEVNGELRKFGMSHTTPNAVQARAGAYHLWNEAHPFGTCTLTLGTWNAPLIDGADRVAWDVAPGEGCQGIAALEGVVAWRPGANADGATILFFTAAATGRGRFEQLEGAEDAMIGTLAGTSFKLARKEEN